MPSVPEYIADRGFNLNFEDHRNSVAVRKGESVLFDGRMATYVRTGTKGVAPSLGKAISIGWLFKKGKEPTGDKTETMPAGKHTDRLPKVEGSKYDGFRGGDFEEFASKEFGNQVIKEEDRIVKRTKAREEIQSEGRKKLEVAGDQVEVKEDIQDLVVSNSTSYIQDRKHSKKVMASDHYGADGSTPLKMKSSSNEEKKRNSFTVDEKTPSIGEDATKAEVERVTKVVAADDSQDAKVIRKMGSKTPEVQEMDGVTLRRPDTTPKEMKIPVEIGTPKSDDTDIGLSQGGVVVKKIGEEGKTKVAIESQEARVIGKIGQKKERPKAKKIEKTDDQDYLSQLPEDWGKMHWVKKEKYILALTDVNFLKFIMTVETLNAVQNACKKRIDELKAAGTGQKSPG